MFFCSLTVQLNQSLVIKSIIEVISVWFVVSKKAKQSLKYLVNNRLKRYMQGEKTFLFLFLLLIVVRVGKIYFIHNDSLRV